MKNFVQELKWRGMLHDITPGTEEHLLKESTSGYIGFDPTAPSLHIGNLAAIMLLKHFQLAGHKPIALIGGATGMIGDPSGKSAEREFLSEETLRFNQEAIKKQLSKFLDFDTNLNPAEIVNNYDWFKEFTFLGFLREAGKFLTINYMISKDSVQKRLETGISFTEFSYQLLQGYDYYWLYKNKNVRIQMGGSDQWGNITTGTEIIRRKENNSEEEKDKAFALTTPLITKSDGSKFGKSESGNIWLDPGLTTPFQFYQFWLNVSDSDCPKLLRVFTLLSEKEITNLEIEHQKSPHTRLMQNALADDLTIRIHSKEALNKAKISSEVLYGKGTIELIDNFSLIEIENIFNNIPSTKISKNDFANCNSIIDLLSETSNYFIYTSKSEARRALQSNAVGINKIKITENFQIKDINPVQSKFILISKGKKFNLIIID